MKIVKLCEIEDLSLTSSLKNVCEGLGSAAGLVGRIAEALAAQAPGGQTNFVASLGKFARMRLRKGLLVVVSDFFDPGGIAAVRERNALERANPASWSRLEETLALLAEVQGRLGDTVERSRNLERAEAARAEAERLQSEAP